MNKTVADEKIILAGKNICKSYKDRYSGKKRIVLDNFNLELTRGESLALKGPSGCGKSTVARILLQLIPADSGQVIFEGNSVDVKDKKMMAVFRRKVQLIGQNPENFFDPIVKLGKSFIEPLKIFGLPVDNEAIKDILNLVKLNEGVFDRYPHQVSGGEIQRLCLARALLLNPEVLILDEATSMLDISVQAQILQLLRKIQQEKNISYLVITHSKEVADFLCQRLIDMEKLASGEADND